MHLVEILYHPLFVVWFQDLVEADIEIAGEVQALIDELELHGRALGTLNLTSC